MYRIVQRSMFYILHWMFWNMHRKLYWKLLRRLYGMHKLHWKLFRWMH